MGEKLYRPKLKADEHLLHSKDHPENVRGVSRDADNKNPNIPEWEEVDADELYGAHSDYSTPGYGAQAYEEDDVELTPEQAQLAKMLGEALAQALVSGGTMLFQRVLSPWWHRSAWPALKHQGARLKALIKHQPATRTVRVAARRVKPRTSDEGAALALQLDQALAMDPKEAESHVMQMYYHALGLVNEIRIIGNARIRQASETDALADERQKQLEQMLVNQLAFKLDELLADEQLHLDDDSANAILQATGGGIRLDGEYKHVQIARIDEALRALPALSTEENA